MYLSIVLATVLLAAGSQASTAHSGKCSVTHKDCYPACVKRTADGSDCAQIKTVCREICGEAPEYAGYEEDSKVVAQPPLPPQGKTVPADH